VGRLWDAHQLACIGCEHNTGFLILSRGRFKRINWENGMLRIWANKNNNLRLALVARKQKSASRKPDSFLLHSHSKFHFFNIDLWYYQSEKESSRTEQLRGQHSVCVIFCRIAQTILFLQLAGFPIDCVEYLLFLTEFFPFTVLFI